jgi:hypothetical protein
MNLLEPITVPADEIGHFLRRRVCYCGKRLTAIPHGDGFRAVCPEHGPVYDHSHTDAHAWAENHNGVLAAASELRAVENESKPRQSEAEILKSLGF